MFIDYIGENIKIYPVVWVKEIDTLFLENSCGSGTIGVTILESVLKNKSCKYKVIQPSNMILETEIEIIDKNTIKVILNGKINTNNKIIELEM